LENVKLSNSLNSLVWTRGIQKPPRRVKVKMIRTNGKSYVYHIDEKIEVPKEEKPKGKTEQAKEDKKEEPKKKEAPAEKKQMVKKEKDKDKKAAASNKQEDIG
jgi:large subunit ribosomal protein L31e